MGWRVNSPTIFVSPGATVRIGLAWKRPGDKGAQWAMAHPIAGEPPVNLATERVGKRVDCEIGVVRVNGPAEFGCGDPKTAFWSYFVDIRNEGTQGCRFQLEGGSV
jgi:hypothetical protein